MFGVSAPKFRSGPPGVVPLGFVGGWLKSFAGVPALALQGRNEWIEANGQTVTDGTSPLSGKVLPDLNGSLSGIQRFLRGATTSGSTGGCDISSANLVSLGFGAFCPSGTGACYACCLCAATCTFSVLPSFYQVVWILRFK